MKKGNPMPKFSELTKKKILFQFKDAHFKYGNSFFKLTVQKYSNKFIY